MSNLKNSRMSSKGVSLGWKKLALAVLLSAGFAIGGEVVLATAPVASMVAVFWFIVFGAFVVHTRVKNFSMSLILFVCMLMLGVYALAILNGLFLLPWVLMGVALGGAGYLIWYYRKSQAVKMRLAEDLDDFLNMQFIVFAALSMVAVLGGIGRYVHVYDEFNMWAYEAKSLMYHGVLGRHPEVGSILGTYTPLLPLWHYVVGVFAGGFERFVEPQLYMGQSMLLAVFLMAPFCFMARLREQEWGRVKELILGAAMFGLGFYFYAFTNLYGDLPIGLMTGAALIMLYVYLKQDASTRKMSKVLLMVIMPMIVLTKPSGFILVFAISVIGVLAMWCGRNKRVLREWMVVVAPALAVFVVWYVGGAMLSRMHPIPEPYLGVIGADYMTTTLATAFDWRETAIFVSAVIKSLGESVMSGMIRLPLFGMVLLMFVGIGASENRKAGDSKAAVLRTLPYVAGYAVFFVLTVASLYVMMIRMESLTLASFGRYLNNLHLGLLMLVVFIWVVWEQPRRRAARVGGGKVGWIVLLAIFLNMPMGAYLYFVSDYPARAQTADARVEWVERMAPVNEIVPNDARVYIIDQDDDIMNMWKSRYYMFPRRTSAFPWSINWVMSDDQEWRLNGDGLVVALREDGFDYVWVNTANEHLNEQLGRHMIDGAVAEDGSLFRVVIRDDAVWLERVS